jgi:hypothetical protein
VAIAHVAVPLSAPDGGRSDGPTCVKQYCTSYGLRWATTSPEAGASSSLNILRDKQSIVDRVASDITEVVRRRPSWWDGHWGTTNGDNDKTRRAARLQLKTLSLSISSGT